MRLYSGPLSMFGAKAQIAMGEKGCDCDVELVPFGLGRGYDPKHPQVVRINPKAQVPVLVDDGVEIYDSTQIFEYLEDRFPSPALWPREVAARAMARQIEHASDEVFFPNVVTLMARRPPQDDLATRAARARIAELYAGLEDRLGPAEWLAGPFSYADIAVYMAQFFATFLGAPMTEATPALQAWRDRMTARPAVAAVVRPMGDYLASQGLQAPPFLSRPAAGSRD